MEWQEREKYDQAMKKLKKGKLQPTPENKPETEKLEPKNNDLFKENFYHASSLTEEQKEILLRNGYRRKPFITLNGASGNNLIIKHDQTNESDYHFCMKNLFREIDFPNSEIEHGNGEFRADVAFIYPEGQIAVEIETGANKEAQVQRKVKWLNNNFNYWIFVCSRNNKKIYKEYVDNEKSFCLTLLEARQKVDELIQQLTNPPQ